MNRSVDRELLFNINISTRKNGKSPTKGLGDLVGLTLSGWSCGKRVRAVGHVSRDWQGIDLVRRGRI